MQRLGLFFLAMAQKKKNKQKKNTKWNQMLKDFSQSWEMNDVIRYDIMCSFSKTNPNSVIQGTLSEIMITS